MTRPERPIQSSVDAPTFDEQWQAQDYVLACHLHDRGYFTWFEWTAELSEVIKAADARDPVNSGADYYRHWLTALERMSVS